MASQLSTRLQPPANDPPIADDGLQHSEAWAAHHQEMADIVSRIGVGTIAGTGAPAGMIGEFGSSIVAIGAAVPLTSFVAADVTSFVLPPGDWDVYGTVVFNPAGTTTMSAIAAWISATPATLPGALYDGGYLSIRAAFITGQPQAIPAGRVHFNSPTPLTVHLSALAGFGVSTMAAYGGLFRRRMW